MLLNWEKIKYWVSSPDIAVFLVVEKHAFLKDPKVSNDVPGCVNVGLFVSLAHFTIDLFVKHSQYVAGFAKLLLLKDGTVL